MAARNKAKTKPCHVNLQPLAAELCHVWDPYLLTNRGLVNDPPSLMSQTQISSLPCSGSPCSHPRTGPVRTSISFVPRSIGLKILHGPSNSFPWLLFFMGVKKTLCNPARHDLMVDQLRTPCIFCSTSIFTSFPNTSQSYLGSDLRTAMA